MYVQNQGVLGSVVYFKELYIVYNVSWVCKFILCNIDCLEKMFVSLQDVLRVYIKEVIGIVQFVSFFIFLVFMLNIRVLVVYFVDIMFVQIM